MKYIAFLSFIFLKLLTSANNILLVNNIVKSDSLVIYKHLFNPIEVKNFSSDHFNYLIKSKNSTIYEAGFKNGFNILCNYDTAILDLFKITPNDTIYIKSIKVLVVDKFPLPSIYIEYSVGDTIYFNTIKNQKYNDDFGFKECEICIKKKLNTTALHYQLKTYHLVVFRGDNILFNKKLDLKYSISTILKELNIQNGDKLLLCNIIGFVQEQSGQPDINFQPIQYTIIRD
jgi:hypothetical protein